MKKSTKMLIGTNNAGKVRELMTILGVLPVETVTLRQAGIEMDVAETGATYEANARLKAESFAQVTGLLTLADDSGLEVEALGGGPGVYSARYAGDGASDAARRARLLAVLRDVPPPRPARFRCVIALTMPEQKDPTRLVISSGLTTHFFEGTCEGEISLEERGTNGFGYDPVFFVPAYGCTMAELPEAVKNQISHRARAAQAALPFLQSWLANRP
jgi:XTP/dITP diphosphohydrolase